MLATITSKGQLTLPAEIRKKLKLRIGDKIDLLVRADGHIEGIPVKQDIASLRGILPKPKKPVSLEQMEKAIAEGGSDARD